MVSLSSNKVNITSGTTVVKLIFITPVGFEGVNGKVVQFEKCQLFTFAS